MSVTVTSCTYLKDWTGKDGKTGKIYDVLFSDGSKGQSFAEISNGTSKDDLEITPNGNYPDKVKAKAKNGFAGGGKPKGNESFAISYSKDLVIAMMPKMQVQPTSTELAKVIITVADTFYNWLETKKK
jgi:hypothetical protein